MLEMQQNAIVEVRNPFTVAGFTVEPPVTGIVEQVIKDTDKNIFNSKVVVKFSTPIHIHNEDGQDFDINSYTFPSRDLSVVSSGDKKFLLLISPQIDEYLEYSADRYRLYKAQVVREAIERTMEKDKEYQGFLKEQKTSNK